MAFVGRDDELAQLTHWWENANDRPALIWGRRRVGKTALIEQFASGLRRAVFHTADGDPMASELRRLTASVRLVGYGACVTWKPIPITTGGTRSITWLWRPPARVIPGPTVSPTVEWEHGALVGLA